MNTNICNCGGYINSISVHDVDEEIYKDIKSCIDCKKMYIEKNNKLKRISNAEFRRILITRQNNNT